METKGSTVDIVDIKDVIVGLRERGARFWIKDGRVHVSAPTGVLTEEILGVIGVRRDEVWRLMIDMACASYEDGVGTQIYEDLAHEAFAMQDRGEYDSEEHAERRRRLDERMDRNREWLARSGKRYSEYERLFGEGCAYHAHMWLRELRIKPREGQIDPDGTIGEVITI